MSSFFSFVFSVLAMFGHAVAPAEGHGGIFAPAPSEGHGGIFAPKPAEGHGGIFIVKKA